MALKVRCSECRKKISVDEAFAGSMCRCPYCKSIVMVPTEAAADAAHAPKRSSRPTAPGTSRPKMPSKYTSAKTGSGLSNIVGSRPIIGGEETAPAPTPSTKIATPKPTPAPKEHDHVVEAPKVNKAELSREQLAAIPMANPVRMQGIATLLMLLVLLIMVAASIYLATQLFKKNDDETGGSYIDEDGKVVETLAINEEIVKPNPFLSGKNGSVAGESVAGPVLYVIDAGSQMGELYVWGRTVARASIRTLPAASQFGVIVACDPEPVLIGGKLLAGGTVGDDAIKTPMSADHIEGGTVSVGGASDLPGAVAKAIPHEPKTIVLICSKKGFDSPDQLAKQLADKSIKLILVSMLIPGDEELKQMKALVKAAGNGSTLLLYEDRELGNFHDESDVPE